jgi:hypothetical protein
LLNLKQVEYLLIGGYAVSYYGYPRATGDMDVWIAINPQNAAKVVEVLKEFGFDVANLSVDLFLQENKVIRMGIPPLRLELLTTISGVEFVDLNSVGYIPRSLLRSVKTASERVLLSEAEPRSVRGVAK